MKVTLIASTQISNTRDTEALFDDIQWHPEPLVTGGEAVAEFAGRSCYQSWHRPNPKTQDNGSYLAHINEVGHYSVLEHGSATFYAVGVSRALTHELVRHRHLNYSQLSQRFVDSADVETVYPPAVLASKHGAYLKGRIDDAMRAAIDAYNDIAHVLDTELAGQTNARKRSREAARAVLPNATETRIVVTGNHRAWRDFLGKRHSTHADAEIQRFAAEVLRQLRNVAPAVYGDIPKEPWS